MPIADSYQDLRTFRMDAVLDWVVPIPQEVVVEAYLGLGPAGGQSPVDEGRPQINLYVNSIDSESATAALKGQLGIVLQRLQRYGAKVRRTSAVFDTGPAFPPDGTKIQT